MRKLSKMIIEMEKYQHYAKIEFPEFNRSYQSVDRNSLYFSAETLSIEEQSKYWLSFTWEVTLMSALELCLFGFDHRMKVLMA